MEIKFVRLDEVEAILPTLIKGAIKEALTESDTSRKTSTQEYATREEVAKRLRISLPTLHTLTKSEVLKSYQIGGRKLYKWDEIETAITEVNTSKFKRKAYQSESFKK